MNYQVAIVGKKEEILGFTALGVTAFFIENNEEGAQKLLEIKKNSGHEEANEKFAIVFVIEDIIKDMTKDDYEKLSIGALPAFIPLPSSRGSTGFGNEKIRRIVEKAVGSDIFGEG